MKPFVPAYMGIRQIDGEGKCFFVNLVKVQEDKLKECNIGSATGQTPPPELETRCLNSVSMRTQRAGFDRWRPPILHSFSLSSLGSVWVVAQPCVMQLKRAKLYRLL